MFFQFKKIVFKILTQPINILWVNEEMILLMSSNILNCHFTGINDSASLEDESFWFYFTIQESRLNILTHSKYHRPYST